MSYIKAGATDYSKHGLSFHAGEFETQDRSLKSGDTVTDAMKIGGIFDVEVGREQAHVRIQETEYALPKETLYMANCPYVEGGVIVLDRNVKDYVPVQNHEFASILDPLTEKMDVAGVVQIGKVGEILAIQLEMPSFTLFGKAEEEHRTYLLISENRATGQKFYGITTTRIVCSNSFKQAISAMPNLPNMGQPSKILQYRTGLHMKAVSLQTDYQETLEKLARKQVEMETVVDVINACYPRPTRGGILSLYDQIDDLESEDPSTLYVIEKGKRANQLFDNSYQRIERHRQNVFDALVQFNDEHSYAANTLYALWNAVTYNANHGKAYRDNEDAKQYNIFFDGGRGKLMEKAWQMINTV